MRFLSPTSIAIAALSVLCWFAQVQAQADEPAGQANFPAEQVEYFEREIRPLLVARCYKCHGDTSEFEGGLRLTTRSHVLTGGDSGPAAIAKQPAESLLIQAVKYDGLQMPPDKKLSADEISKLTKWVELGLPWSSVAAEPAGSPVTHAKPVAPRAGPDFWSFQPVRRTALPAVKQPAWPQQPLDFYILAKLEQQQLNPAPAASKQVLLRRAYFDLLGLPPSPEAVQEFLADETPAAFAKVIDRLLASPQYGERWGRHWLDVVRYTDSFDARGVGGEGDVAAAWRYRDWVTNAFNRDLPFDRFITDQIAGDLQPTAAIPGQPTLEERHAGIIATGLLAIGEWGGGDADKEKLLTDIVDDQINVVSRAFLGLTVACARCHDHKFDPISTADYYGLAGIFFSSHILPNVGPKTNGPPMMRIPLETAEYLELRSQHQQQLAATEQHLRAATREFYTAFAKAHAAENANYLVAAAEFRKQRENGQKLADFAALRKLLPFALNAWVERLDAQTNRGYRLLSQPQANIAGKPGVHAWTGTQGDCPNLALNTTESEVSILTFKLPPHSVAVHPGPQNGVVVRWHSPVTGSVRVTGRIADADPVGGDGLRWALELQSASRMDELAGGEIENGGARDLTIATDVNINTGDSLDLLILPRANYGYDTTVVQLTLKTADGKQTWDLTRELLAAASMPAADGSLKGNPTGPWSVLDMASSKRGAGDFAQQLKFSPQLIAALSGFDAGTTELAVLSQAAQAAATDLDLTDERSPFWIRDPKQREHLPAEAQAELSKLDQQLEQLKKNAPQVPFAHGALEGGVPGSPHAGMHNVKIHHRGRYDRLGDEVPRRFLTVLAGERQPPITSGSGRLELAQQIAAPLNPLTARVWVNRVWQQHFGAGLVRTAGNFGWLGERPSHPELLDYLAARFVEQGGSLKSLHREILLSATWQQTSLAPAATIAADADNRWWGRMNRRRLDAESLRDSLLAASGRLDLTLGGLAVRDLNSPRRTLYVMSIRSDRANFRSLFDGADPTLVVDQRTVSTVAPQALFLLNHPFALGQAKALAEQVANGKQKDEVKLRQLYLRLYGRPPVASEVELGLHVLQAAKPAGVSLEDYCHVLLCANEFMYVD